MNQISLFPSAYSTEPESVITVQDLVERIRSGYWSDVVAAVRSCVTKESRDLAKRSVPCVTLSGTFSKRGQQYLLGHSGYICIDIDTECDRSLLGADPYTYAMFQSISGTGTAIIVPIDPAKHTESFDWLQRYYFDTYGVVIDPKPRNIASLRFISHDPDTVTNPLARRAKTKVRRAAAPKSLPLVYTGDQIGQLVADTVSRNINIAESYEDYLNLSFALADELGEAGRHHFHSLASVSTKYSEQQADIQYTTALRRDASGNRVTIGTFYHMLKQAGVTLPKTNRNLITLAATAKASGEDVATVLSARGDLSATQAESIARSVQSRPDVTLATLASDPEHLIEGLIMFIKTKYPVRRNMVSYKLEKSRSGEALLEEDINDIYLNARAVFNTPNVTKDLVQTILFSSQTPSYHPIKSFIAKHIEVRPTGVIDALVSCVRTDTPHAAVWIRKWLIGIHAAVDGHPVRSMLVFTGPQYNGKTEFFRRLLPNSLRSYYAESKLDRGKDDELLMCQKLIVMDDEMGGKSKQDEKRLKELTSKDTFSLRAPYRRDNMDYKRLAVLCGTSNPTEIISDPTGNTRILPVKVESIDFTKINAIDRTELFMEAYHAYTAGETWLLNAEEIAQLGTISDDFTSICYEQELILQFFSIPDGNAYTDWMTATEIKNEIEVNSKQQIRHMAKFGIELRKLFGDPKTKRKGSNMLKCYNVVRQCGKTTDSTYHNFSSDNQEVPF